MQSNRNACETQGFADASEKVHVVGVYVGALTSLDELQTTLVASKFKVTLFK